jgi:hypothetical protein
LGLRLSRLRIWLVGLYFNSYSTDIGKHNSA